MVLLLLLVCCSIFHFYIKPQPVCANCPRYGVVPYPISTSNHNDWIFAISLINVVPYPISTSNHNSAAANNAVQDVVPYPISTSNHNLGIARFLSFLLFHIPFLHQTTTGAGEPVHHICCSISHFYIKPQLAAIDGAEVVVVPYPISTSNHNSDWGDKSLSQVVPYPISTSNHNNSWDDVCVAELFHIPFLHQTTTLMR